MAVQPPPWAKDPKADINALLAPPTLPGAAPPRAANVPSGSPLGPGGPIVPPQRGVVSGPLSTAPRPDEDTFHSPTQEERVRLNLDPAQPYKINDRTGEPTAVGERQKELVPEKPKTEDELVKARQLVRAAILAAKRSKYRSIEGFTPGLTGAGSSIMAYTPAGDSLQGDLDIIGSNEAFNTLSEMRKASPTGGALGNVTERELDLLKSTNYALKPGQQDVDFARNMDEVVKNYGDLYAKLGGDPKDLENEWGEDNTPATPGEQQEAARAAAVAPGPTAPGAPPGVSTLSYDEQGNVIHDVQGGGSAVASDTGIIGGKGGTHTEARPQFKGANQAINAMLKAKRPVASIAKYLHDRGMPDTEIMGYIPQAQKILDWQNAEGKNYKGDYNVEVESGAVANDTLENVAGSDVGGFAAGYGNAITAYTLDNMAGYLGMDPEKVRTAFAASQAAHPTSSTLGTVAGVVTAAAGGQALGEAAGLSKVPAILTADTAYGAAAQAGATDYNPETGAPASAMDRVKAAAEGGYKGLVASGVPLAGTSFVKALGRPSGNEFARELNKQDIPTTLGSQYGGKFKKFEDWVSGQTGGGFVSDRQREAVTRVNERTFDRVLKPVGAVNKKGLVGEDAVAYARGKISDQYGKALNGKTATLDPDWAVESAQAFQDVADLPTVGPEVLKRVENIVTPHLQGGQLTGEGMQAINEGLRDIATSYHKAGNAQAYEIGNAIDDVSESVFNVFRRQLPDVVPEYNKAQVAYKRLGIASDAVLASENTGGVFMPSTLRRIDKEASKRSGGKIAAAANEGKGKRQFGKLSKAAQERIPKKIPDSGTARLVIPTLLLAGGGGAAAGGEAVHSEGLSKAGKIATLAGILSLAYTKTGQRILTKPGRGITNPRAAQAARKVGEKLAAPTAHLETGHVVETTIAPKKREKKKKPKAK